MKYQQHYQIRQTPQDQPIPGSTQTANNAGGYAWAVDDWTRLDRFLVLGSEGGTYYVGERELTVGNAEAVRRCIHADGPRTVAQIVDVSLAGRAPKNDPALFALAMAASLGSPETKRLALAALPQVARIGTHLFHFLDYVEGFRGWGRMLRRAVGDWYNLKPVEDLAYQAIKYQQRDGWSHQDALRLSHPIPDSGERTMLYQWVTHGWQELWFALGEEFPSTLALLSAVENIRKAETKKEVCDLILKHELPREAIPTKWLGEADVWRALLDCGMPMTALIRNLGNLTKHNILKPLDSRTTKAVERLTNEVELRKASIHPLGILLGLVTYASGGGFRGGGTWTPVPEIVDALDRAFYMAFGNVVPTGKRLVLALDVSWSMGGSQIAGTFLSARQAAGAMALVAAAAESSYTTVAFSHEMVPLTISPRQRLDDVCAVMERVPFGKTDCALPMLWALENGIKADAFIIYTDSQTWWGKIHPVQALQRYRRQTNIPAMLIVVGMCSTDFSIADPNDGGMLDVVGFDAATPQVISDFIAPPR